MSPSDAAREPPTLALRLIMLEKLAKSVLALVAAAVFAGLLATGASWHLHGMAAKLRDHVSAAWSVYVADALVSVTERRHLAVATSALALDGVVTALEWYALYRGRVWGEWLVVVAMSSLLPFEVVALIHHHRAGRFVILAVNVAIVAYLVRHALRRRAIRAAAGPA